MENFRIGRGNWKKLRLECFSFEWGLFLLEEGRQVIAPLRYMIIPCWISQMFLQDVDMSYLSYSTYILNLLYIAWFE